MQDFPVSLLLLPIYFFLCIMNVGINEVCFLLHKFLSVCLSSSHTSLIFVTELSEVLEYSEFTMSATRTIDKCIFSPFLNEFAKVISLKEKSTTDTQ